MATVQKDALGEQWRLGIELSDDHEPGPVEGLEEEPARDLSRERLERPLHVVTAEHLAWATITAYAMLTRLTALGARPLDAVEARQALYQFDLASTGTHLAAGIEPGYAGWVHLLTAGIFAIGGASDYTARVVFALAGLLMVAMAFELRHYVGRAGAIAMGAMIALSPSLTWYSRASATVTVAAAMGLVTVAVFMALQARPDARRAAALGLCAGLMMAADPAGLATGAIFVAALIPFGLWDLVTRKQVMLAMRVWIDRYSVQLVTVIVVAAGVWAVSQMFVPGGLSAGAIAQSVAPSGGGEQQGFVAELIGGLRFHAAVVTLYEFAIALAAVLGTIVIIGLKARSRFAAWALIWMALSAGYFAWSPERDASSVVMILTPAAVVGAIGIGWLHHRESWRMIRWPLAAVAALTLYIGAISNFVWDAPDASEAPWARHATLFMGATATTEQARLYSRQAANGVAPAVATVAFDDAVAAPLRWYLRELRPIDNAEAATVVVGKTIAQLSGSPAPTIYHFDVTQGWVPDFAIARAGDVIRFLFTGRTWGPVTSDDVSIMVRKPAGSAPTVILTPGQ